MLELVVCTAVSRELVRLIWRAGVKPCTRGAQAFSIAVVHWIIGMLGPPPSVTDETVWTGEEELLVYRRYHRPNRDALYLYSSRVSKCM